MTSAEPAQPLPHQIVLTSPRGHAIAVSCTCLRRNRQRSNADPIEVRPVFPAAEALAAYRAWHAALGIEVG